MWIEIGCVIVTKPGWPDLASGDAVIVAVGATAVGAGVGEAVGLMLVGDTGRTDGLELGGIGLSTGTTLITG